MNRRIRSLAIPALAVAATLVLASCGGHGEHDGHDHEQGEEVASAPLNSDELKLKLAAADALDGTTDQVVERCSGCRLGMAGKAEHSITVNGYELHMCSESCKAAFSKDLEANLAELEIPQS